MKTRDILLVAGIGLLAWYLLKGKKTPLKVQDLTAGSGGSPAPALKGNGAPEPVAKLNAGLKQPLTVEDFNKKVTPVIPPKDFVLPVLEKPALREPVKIAPVNLIPNVYDRGVNQPLGETDQFYASFAGVCSENMESACKCTSERREKYKLDIPKLP